MNDIFICVCIIFEGVQIEIFILKLQKYLSTEFHVSVCINN